MNLQDTIKVGNWLEQNRANLESDNVPLEFIVTRILSETDVEISATQLNKMIKGLGIVRGSSPIDWQWRYQQIIHLLETRGLYLEHSDDGKFKLRVK